jgi:hypothetical protein
VDEGTGESKAAAAALQTCGAQAGAAAAAEGSAGPMDVDAGCALAQVGAGVLQTSVALHLYPTYPLLYTMTSTVPQSTVLSNRKRIAVSAYLLHMLLL